MSIANEIEITEGSIKPASRVRDLGDQSVSVTSIENTRHLGALTTRIRDALQVRRVLEFLPDVGIGESADHVLPVK